MHDWPDRQCRIILERIVAAMKKGYSKLILNEMVLPNTGVNPLGAQMDLMVRFSCLTVGLLQRWRE